MDHGFEDVDAPVAVAHEAAPPPHPSEGALDDPAPWQHFEVWFGIGPADNFEDEVTAAGSIHQLGAIMGSGGAQMLEREPALADSSDDGLRSCAVGDVGRGGVD